MTTTRLFIIQTVLAVAAFALFHLTIDRLEENVHASYFIERFNIAALILIGYGLLFTIVYYLLRKCSNKVLGHMHFIFGLPLFVLTFAELGLYNHDPFPRRYYTTYDSKVLDVFPVFTSTLFQVTTVLFAAGLRFFFINLGLRKSGKRNLY